MRSKDIVRLIQDECLADLLQAKWYLEHCGEGPCRKETWEDFDYQCYMVTMGRATALQDLCEMLGVKVPKL